MRRIAAFTAENFLFKSVYDIDKSHSSCQVLAAVIVVNSLTLTHYQHADLGYSFVANIRYHLIRESLIFATFSATGMGIGLYARQLIREYIRYLY